MPSNTHVTQADRNAAATIVASGNPGVGNGNKVIADEIKGGLHDEYNIVQAFARHRQSSSNAGGVDVDALREALERIRARASNWVPKEGYDARIAWIEAELDDEPNRLPYGNGDVPPCRNGYEVADLIAEHAGLVAHRVLASISTPTAEPMAELQRLGQEYDAAARDALALRLAAAHDEISGSPTRAVVAIKAGVDMCRDYWLHIADAALSSPTPDRIGKDAVREALERVRAILEQGRDGASQYRQVRIVAALNEADRALSATPAQEEEI